MASIFNHVDPHSRKLFVFFKWKNGNTCYDDKQPDLQARWFSFFSDESVLTIRKRASDCIIFTNSEVERMKKRERERNKKEQERERERESVSE